MIPLMLLGLAATLSVCAAPQAELTSVRLEGPPPVPDGNLDEPVWKQAATASNFRLLGEPEAPAQQQTRVYLLHDDERLYVGWECLEDKMGELVAGVGDRDGEVYLDDCFEVFISAGGSGHYYHFLVNPLGVLRDERDRDPAWDSSARAATSKTEGGWQGELIVPIGEMRLPADVSEHWRVNFCRAEQPHNELSTWAPLPGKSFHEPSHFGDLRGLDFDYGKLLQAQTSGELTGLLADIEELRAAAKQYQSVPQGSAALARAASLQREGRQALEALPGAPDEPRVRELAESSVEIAADTAKLRNLISQLPLAEAAGEAGYVICQASTMTKVVPDRPYEGAAAEEVRLSLAGNEYEAAQAVIVPVGRGLKEVKVAVTALTGPGGASIGPDQIVINRVGYVEVEKSTRNATLGPGRVPDPLLENAPFDVPRAEVRSVWVTVHAPADQPAGVYRGTLSVEPQDAPRRECPVVATVWDFALPRTSFLRTSYGIGLNISKYYPDVTPGEGRPPQWTAGAWVGADMEGRPNYFGDMDYAVAFDEEVKHAGENSVRLQITRIEKGTHESPRFCYYTEVLQLAPEAEYVFSIWYRTAPGEDPHAAWWMPKLGGAHLPPTNGEWREAVKTLNSGDTQRSRLYLRAQQVGTVWFDDVRLARADAPADENLLPNPGLERGRYTAEQLLRAYREDMLRHRCSDCHIISPQVQIDEDGGVTMDWTEFDEEMSYLIERGLNGFNINWCRLPRGWGKVEGWGEEPTEEQKKQIAISSELLRQTQEHLVAKGWADLGYIYTIDEPGEKAFDAIKQAFGLVHEVSPRLKTLLTYGYGASRPVEPGNPKYAALAGFVDIHVPHSDCFEPIYLDTRREGGDEIWCYVCISAGRPYLNMWAIDYPGTDHRILFWQMFDKEITGFLYWAVTYWKESPWDNPMTYPGGNGDGSLLYPGEAGPVDCVRLEINRDGIEDYDMLAMLKAAADRLQAQGEGGAAAAARLTLKFPEITTDWKEYTEDPAIVERQRAEVAAALQKALRQLDLRSIEPEFSRTPGNGQ